MLLDAIFLGDRARSRLSREFVVSARALAFAALTLSDRCSVRAGLGRDEIPETVATDEIVQPHGERLARLRNAVTFSLAELETRLSRLGVDLEVLSPLTTNAGTAMVSEVDFENLPVYRRPILRIEESYVLFAPGSLAPALTHAILRKAFECGDLPALAELIRDTAFERVDRALNLLGYSRLLGPKVSTDPAFPATRAAYRIDTDKVLELLLVTDPLEDFDPATIDGDWSAGEINRRVEEHIRVFENQLAIEEHAPNGVLALVTVASPGRGFVLGLGEFRFVRSLLISADDLEVIAHTEAGNPLLLWQYAKASDRIRDYARPWGFNPLDEFAFWRSNGFSYYMSDDQKPTLLLIAPGTALTMRVEARDELDIHAVRAPSGNGTVEVMRFQTRDVPIYMARPGSVATLSLAVDGLPLTLWIEATRPFDDPRSEGLMRALVDFFAYWIWQFKPHLHETLERLAVRFDPLVLEVDLVESEAWFAEDPAPGEPLEIVRSRRGLKFTILEGAAALLEGGDNAGEREIVRRVLETLHDLGRDVVGANERPSDGAVTQALEAIAPLGLKKKLLLLGGEASAFLDERGLPPYRPLQPAVTEEWRDREHELLSRSDLTAGPIAHDERVPTLKKMVAESFASFELLVAALNPAGLLENLVAYGERLIWMEQNEQRLMPTRIACYGSVPKMAEELTRNGPVLATTAVAHRFVTEYVVARPPNGFRPFSLEAYDELIALAAILMGWGRHSDAIHYGLADTDMSVLASGRLSSLAIGYEAAVGDYGERVYAEQIVRSSLAFSSMFEGPTDPVPKPPISVSELDAATTEEFGVSITQIAELIEALVEIGSTQQQPTKRLPEAEVRERLATELSWTGDELDAAFRLLTLGPRVDFLKPPRGFERRDLYPWAFNRRMSHLGRPLLLKETSDSGTELLWGTRALIRTNHHLFRQLIEGRHTAQSSQMRSLQGIITNHSGEVFNDRVADAYETATASTVRRRVKSIADQRIERGAGQPLGDIDVLVADPSVKEMLLVETKNFSAARTPAEFGTEEKKLRKALKTHGERTAWLGAHLRDALQWLGIDDSAADEWRVVQLVVVSGEAFTPSLRELPVRVLTLSTLRDELAAAGVDHPGSASST